MDVLLMLAVLPAVVLLVYVWRLDPVEKEPPGLLLTLLFFGIVSTIPAALIEGFGPEIYDGSDIIVMGSKSLGTLLFENFIGVALVEESCKLVFLKWQTWNNREFDYVFDGIVYAVFVGLGFAIAENINYVFSYGFETGVLRAVTAIPGHCVFAVFMGYFYGMAKYAQTRGKNGRKAFFAVCTIVVPVFCHGAYDSLASLESDAGSLAFFVFLIVMVGIGMHLAKRASAKALRIR